MFFQAEQKKSKWDSESGKVRKQKQTWKSESEKVKVEKLTWKSESEKWKWKKWEWKVKKWKSGYEKENTIFCPLLMLEIPVGQLGSDPLHKESQVSTFQGHL